MIDLTIITPTYNRAELLKRCFSSLLEQTSFEFEWIVVNDGSTDGTGDVMRKITEGKAPFPIQYIEKENGGKHTALNASHPYIHGKYVLILDSDDTLTPDAVSVCLEGWRRWEADASVGIVIFLRGFSPEDPLCYAKDENVLVDVMSYQRVCVHSSDACEVIRSDLFRRFPFPVFPGERFLAEGSLWGRVSFVCQCVYINRIIYLCDYLEGGLTKSGRPMRIRTPLGGMDNANIYMAKKNPLKIRIKNGLLFSAYGYFANMSPKRMAMACDHKALMLLCLPAGWLLYIFWKKKYGGNVK